MERPPCNRSCLFGAFVLACTLMLSPSARAQTITVTSAVPDAADQGAVDLVVTIGGENFGKGSKVAFFVTGTTNPGGITVKNVKYKNAKTLEATIDVAPDAQTDLKFDIQVMSNGRTGKGTELFSVRVKSNIEVPPGSVSDLRVVDTGFNSAVFAWTAPADNGFDLASGPVAQSQLRVRAASCGPWTEDVWYENASDDPCWVFSWGYPAAEPGTPVVQQAHWLMPNTQYVAMVRSYDDATPVPVWSPMVEDLAHQVSFTTGPFPPAPWTTEFIEACPGGQACPSLATGFVFDPAGNPAMFVSIMPDAQTGWLRRLASWTGSEWLIEPVGSPVGSLVFDPVTGQATGLGTVPMGGKNAVMFYRRTGATSDPWDPEAVVMNDQTMRSNGPLKYNPVSYVPTIAYTYRGKGRVTVRVAERRSGTWVSEDVAPGYVSGGLGLAFDASGNPALTLQGDTESQVVRFAVRRANGSWQIEAVDRGPDGPFTHLEGHTVVFDPVRGDFSVASLFGTSSYGQWRVRFCERASGTWTCETIEPSGGDFPVFAYGPSLAFAPDGTAYLAHILDPTLFVSVRKPGGTWTHECGDWNAGPSSGLRIGPDGQPGIVYYTVHDASGVGNVTAIRFARRHPPSP